MSQLVSDHETPDTNEYWAPLEAFVCVEDFRRQVPRDTFTGEWGQGAMDWPTYLAGFRTWRASRPRYRNMVRRIAEFDDLVYLEIDEHHGDRIFTSLSTYQFNADSKVVGVRVAAAADRLSTLTSEPTSDR
jgi:hypothetical protein